MPVYGYKTAKFVNYGASIRWPNNAISCHDFRTSSHKQARAMAYGIAKNGNGKVIGFQSQDEMSSDDQARWGFTPCSPASTNGRIDYDLARD